MHDELRLTYTKNLRCYFYTNSYPIDPISFLQHFTG